MNLSDIQHDNSRSFFKNWFKLSTEKGFEDKDELGAAEIGHGGHFFVSITCTKCLERNPSYTLHSNDYCMAKDLAHHSLDVYVIKYGSVYSTLHPV